MSISRPLKAPTESVTDEQLSRLTYPLVGSPKLDGFRCMVDQGIALTSSMKPFQNRFVQEVMSDPIFSHLDGELLVGEPNSPDAFHNTSGPLRRFDGEPNFKFYVFDDFTFKDMSYHHRWLGRQLDFPHERIIVLSQTLLESPEDVIAYEKEMLEKGFEGAMIRSISGRYKEGRATFNEMNIFKRKPFVESEAVIMEILPQMENLNEAFYDERGLLKRSSHQENLVPKDTIGKFILFSRLWKAPFSAAPGKGFDQRKRDKMWKLREQLRGEIVTFKYQKYGSRDAPRMPTVVKFRPVWDLEGE